MSICALGEAKGMWVNMKKILYIAISSQTGGVPRHILQALRHAKEYGYKVAVAAPDDGDYYPWFRQQAAGMLKVSFKPYSFRSLWKIRCYIRKNRIELVHSHGKGAGMYARPLKLLCPGIKVVHTFHGVYIEEYGVLLRAIYCQIERRLRHWTDHFICVSQSERKEAMRLRFADRKRTSVICNGVEPEHFQGVIINRNQYLKEFGFPQNAYLIGCVARLEQMKGHQYLLSAFAKLIKKHPQCRLVLVGDGPERESIEAQIQEQNLGSFVCLTGFRHDVPQLLKLFDMFVSASLKEGMPYTLIEALAAGTPVTATDVIGNRDVIHGGKNGFLVRAESAEDLAEMLDYAVRNSELCKKYSVQGQRMVHALFTEERFAGRLFGVYDKVMERHGK